MYTFIIILTVLVSILLIVVVLVQKSKGGGLSSSFAGSNQIMGVRRTNDFIEKATWTLAIIICLLSIISVFVMPRNVIQSGARVKPVNEVQTVSGTEFATPAATPTATATEEVATEEVAVEETAAPAETPAEAPAE